MAFVRRSILFAASLIAMPVTTQASMLGRFGAIVLLIAYSLAGAQTPLAPSLGVLYQSSGVLCCPPSNTGAFVALLDDLNGDGCAEYLVFDLNSSVIGAIRSGADGSFYAPLENVAVHNCARLGDLNSDGISEYALTTTSSLAHPFAEAIVYDGVSGIRIYTFVPHLPANIVDDIADIGDLDGDGVSDFCVGVASAAPAGSPAPGGGGAVFVYSGAIGTLLYRIDAGPGVTFFGSIIAALGDVNGDGFPDVAIVHRAQSAFSTAVFACSPTGATPLYFYPNEWTGLTTVGDIDGDGRPDFMLGSSGSGNPFLGGPLNIYSGATGQLIWSITSPQSGFVSFGYQAVLAGDVDGDGFNDLAISSPAGGYVGQSGNGIVYIYSTITRELLFELHGQGNNSFGGTPGYPHRQTLDGGRDVNGDGFADIIVGDPRGSYARVYAGGPAMSSSGAVGNVMAPWGTEDVLRLAPPLQSPTAGGLGRTVTAPLGTAINLWMARPPGHGGVTASFAVFGRAGAIPSLSSWPLPYDIGVMCFLPSLLSPGDGSLFIATNNFGGVAGFVPSTPSFMPSPGGIVASFGAIPVSITVVVQGLIEDSSRPGVPLAVTNAVRLIVH